MKQDYLIILSQDGDITLFNSICLEAPFFSRGIKAGDSYRIFPEFTHKYFENAINLAGREGSLEFTFADNSTQYNVRVSLLGSAKEHFSFVIIIRPLHKDDTFSDINTYKQFQANPIPSSIWKKEKGVLKLHECNQAFYKMISSEGDKNDFRDNFFKINPQISEKMNWCIEKKESFEQNTYLQIHSDKPHKPFHVLYSYLEPEKIILYLADNSKLETALAENAKLAAFPNENPNPVLRVSSTGMIEYSNKAGKRLLKDMGFETKDLLPAHWQKTIQNTIDSGKNSVELKVNEKIYLFNLTALPDVKVVYIYGSDITDRKLAEEQLKLSGIVFESAIEGISITDKDGNILSINPAFTTITGYTQNEAVGQNPRILKSDRHNDSFYKELWSTLIETGEWRGEIWNRRKNGETYPEWLSITSIKDDEGEIRYFIAVFTDITDIKHKEEKIKFQAYHDPLTNLPNRNLLNDRINTELINAGKFDHMLAVIFLDVNGFSSINNSYGHVVGDYLLIAIAQRLKSSVPKECTISRIGGDEFVIVLSPIKSAAEAAFAVNELYAHFAAPFKIQEHEIFIGLSVGIAVYPFDGKDEKQLIRSADLALYHSKRESRNNYQFYTSIMKEAVSKRVEMENNLRKALENKEFCLFYQPIVNLSTMEIAGSEALIRWKSSNGMVSPGEFIPLAEQTGLIVPIGQWVLEKAFGQNLKWQNLGYDKLWVSVNMSAKQFAKSDIIEDVEAALSISKLNAASVALEITENSLMKDRNKAAQMMQKFKHRGFKFSIDDFGTGYSSLSYLKKFPLNTLKIDRSFVIDLPNDPDSVAIARAIIALAKSMNFKVIAEGVETYEQLSFLRANMCDEIQGYLFSRPLPPKEFEELLKEHKEKYFRWEKFKIVH